MARHWFKPPVKVITDIPGLSIEVSSVERASEVLLSWQDHGPAWHEAARICLGALEGKVPTEEARAAFEAAAREANKLAG